MDDICLPRDFLRGRGVLAPHEGCAARAPCQGVTAAPPVIAGVMAPLCSRLVSELK